MPALCRAFVSIITRCVPILKKYQKERQPYKIIKETQEEVKKGKKIKRSCAINALFFETIFDSFVFKNLALLTFIVT